MKPRCRWRIGEREHLAPYTIKVYLCENKRRNGKVRQETIAFLGSIDAACLPEFWENVDPDRLNNIRANNWEKQAIAARVAFWQAAGPKLNRLANRLGPDLKRIKMAIHNRISWPKKPERDRLELLKAEFEAESWKGSYDHTTKMIETNERIMTRAKEQNTELRENALTEIRLANEWAAKAQRLKDQQGP